MNSHSKMLFKDVVEASKRVYGDKLKEIFLYGSYAKGVEDDESDIDIMVLLALDNDEMKKYADEVEQMISDLSYKHMKVLSYVEVNYDFFMNWVDVVPYYKNVLNEGVVLYAA